LSGTTTQPDMVCELVDYLNQKGRTLLIKGLPGTGKTTLALHLLGRVGHGEGVYFSSRVSDESMRRQFTGLNRILAEKNFVDTRLGLAETFLEQVFDAFRRRPPIVVLDSWDAYAKKIGEVERLKTEEVLITLASASDSSLVFVGESVDNSNIDFLVDAIVEMRTSEVDGRLIREMVTQKLRGKPIWRNHELISLHDAKIHTMPVYRRPDYTKANITLREDRKEFFTLGDDQLDQLFGGLRRGSMLLIELSDDAPYELAESIGMACVLNQLAQDRRAIIVPPMGVNPILFLRKYESVLPWPTLKDRVRILLFEQLSGVDVPSLSEDQSSGPVSQISVDNVKDLAQSIFKVWGGAKKRSKDGGVIGFVDVSQFETMFATKMDYLIELTAVSISRLSLLGDSIIFVSREDSQLKQKIHSVSDTHVKITMKHGVGLIYGVKPYTPIYGLNQSENPVKPAVTPII
jgi:KaiC/GvpD/RAD55 family RecA-like ATPase